MKTLDQMKFFKTNMQELAKEIREATPHFREYPKATMTSRQMNNETGTFNCKGIKEEEIRDIVIAHITPFATVHGIKVTTETDSYGVSSVRLNFSHADENTNKEEEIEMKEAEMVAQVAQQEVAPAVIEEITAEGRQDIRLILSDAIDVVANDSATSQEIVMALAEVVKLHRRITKPRKEQPVTVREDGVTLVGHTVTITCSDCGKEHIIKKQDAKQVKRCPVCQKKYRMTKRAEARKAKRAEAKAAKAAVETTEASK